MLKIATSDRWLTNSSKNLQQWNQQQQPIEFRLVSKVKVQIVQKLTEEILTMVFFLLYTKTLTFDIKNIDNDEKKQK